MKLWFLQIQKQKWFGQKWLKSTINMIIKAHVIQVGHYTFSNSK